MKRIQEYFMIIILPMILYANWISLNYALPPTTTVHPMYDPHVHCTVLLRL